MAIVSNLQLAVSGTDVVLTWANNPNTCVCGAETCDEYDNLAVLRNTSATGTYTNISGTLSGTDVTYTDSTTSSNTKYWYKVIVDDCNGCVGAYPADVCAWKAVACSPVSITHWVDTITETLDLTDLMSDSYNAGTLVIESLNLDDSGTADVLSALDTVSETLTLTDSLKSAGSLRSDYAYFLGSSDGELYEYASDYKGDNSISFASHWRSETTDFSKQYPQYIDDWKTVYGGKVIYVDKDANTAVTLYYSTDGGVTWTSGGTNTVGNGDGTTKDTKFYFIKTGKYWDFKIEHASASNEFQWIGLELDFLPRGRHKEIS